MIPILYEKTETAFTSNGLGALTDAITCTVTEARNGSYELELTYPISGIHYADIHYSRIILAVPSDGANAEPFEIYKITRPIGGTVTVYAQHLSYRLSYTATCPSGKLFTSANDALQSLKTYAASDCPFTFSTDVSKAGQFQNLKVQSIRSLLGGQTGSVLDVYGGEYKFSKWNVSLLQARGASTPIRLEYGKNITDLKQEENIASTYTAVIAMWTKQDGDGGTDIAYGNLVKTSNADAFPYLRTYVYDVSSDYQDKPSKDTLTARAQSYITSNGCGIPKISIDVSFVALWQTEEYKDIAALEHIHLCDTISVDFPALGVSSYAKVVKTKYNTLAERYESIEVGDSKTSLAQTIVDGEQQVLTEANAKFEIASNAIIAEVKRASSAEGTLSSRIQQNAEAITTKVTQGQVESTIEQKADSIRLKAKNIVWTADNSSMTADGHLTCQNATVSGTISASAGSVGGFNIVGNTLQCNKTGKGEWTGSGVYIGPDGLAIGQIDGWKGQPVLRVDTDGDLRFMKVSALGFYRENQSMGGESGGIIWADPSGAGANNKGILVDGSVDASAQFYVNGEWVASDRRLKNDIESIALEESEHIIRSLRPVSYTLKRINDGKRHRGFIAQEVEEVVPKDCGIVGTKGDEELGERHLLSYIEIIADLVNVVQNQEARIAALEGEVDGKG